ncbi:hypothetical protein EZV62_003210 [Acer yangbiense]|uniref:HMA domain-containing protein n=1 Tax=Acer yangbiense TaxID=1000413 RepID=A0A5C7IGV2_9ROSI|nr:hypothetical protein EZV62_003210 [Acer yangbiense]
MQHQKNTCKTEVVIKVPVHSQKCRSKAMQIAVGASGVESSAFLKGDDKDQIEVTRDGIDEAKLTKLLKRNLGMRFWKVSVLPRATVGVLGTLTTAAPSCEIQMLQMPDIIIS